MTIVDKETEAITGVMSFCVALFYLFLAITAAHSLRDCMFSGPIAGWGLALVATSRRASNRGVVVFRIVSIAVMVVGAFVAAVLLPDLHGLHS
jgi:hypothetical protein